MSRRIQEDHSEFWDVVKGKVDDQIKKYVRNGKMIGFRPRGDRFVINIPEIDIPSFRYGRDKNGWGRGKGKEGDIIGKPDQGGVPQAGDTTGDTIPVGIDLSYILSSIQEELELPELIPKDCSQVFKEKIVYNGIKKVGPESLRHTRRTLSNTLKRMIQTDTYCDADPILIPIQEDKRFRSWNVKNIPESNSVIFFARDWSGSMDDVKCESVMNTCWWIENWIKQFYKRTEVVYIGHDTQAKEVDRTKFYSERYGGGTICSSAFKMIDEKIEFSYNPSSWNIYVFYFSDGENMDGDNDRVIELINKLNPNVNLIGIGQILCFYDLGFLEEIKNKCDQKKIRLFDQQTSDPAECFRMIKKFLGKSK